MDVATNNHELLDVYIKPETVEGCVRIIREQGLRSARYVSSGSDVLWYLS